MYPNECASAGITVVLPAENDREFLDHTIYGSLSKPPGGVHSSSQTRNPLLVEEGADPPLIRDLCKEKNHGVCAYVDDGDLHGSRVV